MTTTFENETPKNQFAGTFYTNDFLSDETLYILKWP